MFINQNRIIQKEPRLTQKLPKSQNVDCGIEMIGGLIYSYFVEKISEADFKHLFNLLIY